MSDQCPIHNYPWRDQPGMVNGIAGLHCGYDGSMHPDAFMALLEQPGTELGPTDKGYKVYVKAGGREDKFYFEHLSDAQRDRFIQLLNEKKLTIGYPGRFYVIPFFIQREERT